MIPLVVAVILMAGAPSLTSAEMKVVRARIGEIDPSCTRALRSFPQVRVVGAFANDRGCIDEGYVFAGRAVKSLAKSSPVLSTVFHRSKTKAKEAAALAWTEEAVFQNRALAESPDKGFGGAGEPRFARPSARSKRDGRIEVTVWVREPAGMRPVVRYTRYEVTFSPEGDVVGRHRLASRELPMR